MKKILLAFVAFICTIMASSKAHAVLDADVRYWFSNLDSNIQASSGAIIGTEVDFVDDLGLDDAQGFAEGRITLELGPHKLRYGYLPMSWDGTKTLATNITFAGQTFTAATTTQSEIDVAYHRLGYQFDIFDLLNNSVGLIVEIKYFDTKATVQDSTGVINVAESFDAPIPAVGVAAQAGLPFLFSVSGELTGFTLGSNAYVVDLEAMVNLTPAPFVKLSGGYRYFQLHLQQSDDKADITLSGPFINLRADF